MAAQSCVPRPSCSNRVRKLVAPAYLASDQKEPSSPEITELLRQLMHVQQESLSRLIKWSESKDAHQGRGIAVDAVALFGYVEEMKHIISQSRSIICKLDESLSKWDSIGNSKPTHGCGHLPTHYLPPTVPELHSPPPPPPPTAPGYPPYPPQHGPPSAIGYLPCPPPGYLDRAQQYAASGSFPHPPTHAPPGHSKGHWQDAGRDCDWDVDARQQGEKRRRIGGNKRDEAYELEKLRKYKSEASEAEIQDFLAGLPKDGLSANEERMRAALLEAVTAGAGLFNKMSFLSLGKDEAVRKAKAKLLPRSIAIERWMEARIPELFVVRENRNGFLTVGLKESKEDHDLRVQELKDARENATSEFLETLPEDDLTAEEHNLHDALLESWRICVRKYGIGKVRLSHIAQGEDVRKAKAALLPAAVSVRQWIEARMGQEIVLSMDDDEQLMATFPDRESSE